MGLVDWVLNCGGNFPLRNGSAISFDQSVKDEHRSIMFFRNVQ